MQVGTTNGAAQVAQSIQAVNNLIKQATDGSQEVSDKLMKVAVQQKVGSEQAVDVRA